MSEAVADSTVLIYLAKLDHLEALTESYSTILIPEAVYREVVEKGKDLGENDAFKVEKQIDKGLIQVKTAKIQQAVEKFEMEKGEKEVLSLAKQEKISQVLIDESSVREIAKTLDLNPRGTLYFLLKTVKDGEKDLEDFLELLEKLSESGFHMNEKVYMKAVKEAQQLANK